MENVDLVRLGNKAEVRKPRCRICRHEDLRAMVNQLLGWQGVPVRRQGRCSRRVTYADILRDLEPAQRGPESLGADHLCQPLGSRQTPQQR